MSKPKPATSIPNVACIVISPDSKFHGCRCLLLVGLGGRARKHPPPVRERDPAGIRQVRSVLGEVAFHRDLISLFQRRPSPALPDQYVRAAEFKIPIGD